MQPPFKRASFWRKLSKSYPKACTSIGSKVGCFHGRYWWQATGEAREEFNSVEEDFLNELEAVFTDSCSSIVHFRLYLIGRTEESAVPTIMFFCEEKEPRKRAKKAIEEAGLLQRLPGFRLGHQAKQPNVGTLIQPAVENNGVRQHSRLDSVVDVYFDSSRPIVTSGMPIFIRHKNNVIRRATANAVFHREKIAYMSVAHVFEANGSEAKKQTHYDGEYDVGSGSEHEDDDECVEVTSRGSISIANESFEEQPDFTASRSESSVSRSERTFPQRVTSTTRPTLPLPTKYSDGPALQMSSPVESLEFLGCLILSSVELDCAIIQIKNIDVYSAVSEPMSTTREYIVGTSHSHAPPPEFTAITTHTSHGTISGLLSDDATYMRLPGSLKFQRVFQITLVSPLNWGDCGAVVVNSTTAEPYGHVVASSTPKLVAYIMMASKTFRTLDLQWKAPSAVTVKPNISNIETEVALSRTGSISSQESTYAPMPTGKWYLRLHGSCPRCHHHHTAIPIEVESSSDSNTGSRVQCKKCKGTWLYFGGTNSTQISLLSTQTVEPDPVEKEVRLTLINMIKSATTLNTVASQSLAEIPESSRTTTDQQTSSVQTKDLLPTALDLGGKSARKRPYANIKRRVHAQLDKLRKLSIKQAFPTSKAPRISAKSLGKLPVQDTSMEETSAREMLELDKKSAEIRQRIDHRELRQQLQNVLSIVDESESYEAVELRKALLNAPLEELSAEERVAWMRNWYTQFKSHRVRHIKSVRVDVTNSGTQTSHGIFYNHPWEGEPPFLQSPRSSSRASCSYTLVDDGTRLDNAVPINNTAPEDGTNLQTQGTGMDDGKD